MSSDEGRHSVVENGPSKRSQFEDEALVTLDVLHGRALRLTGGDEIVEAIEDLPEDFRVTLVLSDIEDLSYEEISEELEDEDAEMIRCHVEQCERCYPMYNWEKLFLDVLKERGGRPEPSDALRRRVAELLDRESA